MSTTDKKKVWLHFQNSTNFGPGKVVENLLKGFAKSREETGFEIVSKPAKADFIGCLQNPGPELASFLPTKSLMGPNIFVLPVEMPGLCAKFTNFVTPSTWVQEKYKTFPIMSNKNIYVWPVGIDTEEWTNKRKKPSEVSKKFFVYHKNTPQSYVEQSIKAFELRGMKCLGVVTYGKYNNDDLKMICDASEFAVLCTNTESQGIAYMSILSTGTPCYVVNEIRWQYDRDRNITADATSVPYFDSRCGRVENSQTAFVPENVESFLGDVHRNAFDPRQYILENHTLKMSAKAYLSLLEKCFKV